MSVVNTLALDKPLIETLDIKEHFTAIEGDFIQRLTRSVIKKNPILIEVGSWKGYSSSFLGQIAKNYNGTLYCVDHWRGSTKEHDKTKNCFEIFTHNMQALGLSNYIRPMMMDSKQAMKLFDNEVADLVFLDADHTYEGLKVDIMGWMTKVKHGGILCGHDAEIFYTHFPFGDEWLGVEYITITQGDRHIDVHPGVVKALYDCFNDLHGIGEKTHIWFIKRK